MELEPIEVVPEASRVEEDGVVVNNLLMRKINIPSPFFRAQLHHC
jgi:hypothetical protein